MFVIKARVLHNTELSWKHVMKLQCYYILWKCYVDISIVAAFARWVSIGLNMVMHNYDAKLTYMHWLNLILLAIIIAILKLQRYSIFWHQLTAHKHSWIQKSCMLVCCVFANNNNGINWVNLKSAQEQQLSNPAACQTITNIGSLRHNGIRNRNN